MATFIGLAAAGHIINPSEAVDDWISIWHEMRNSELPLYGFLGMTREEYAIWVRKPALLQAIIQHHRMPKRIDDLEHHLETIATSGVCHAE